VSTSKIKGGLGVKDLRKENISLLTKWWWKLENQDGLWQRIVKQKYPRNKYVAYVKTRANYYPDGKLLLKIKGTYCEGRRVIFFKDLVTFWLDTWLDHVAICVQFLIFLWSKIFLLDEVVT
jgi:hypothetical protein